MTRQILLAVLLLAAGPVMAQSELEGSPIHPPPLRIVPAPSLAPAAPAASADHPQVPATRATPKTPAKKRKP